MRSGVCTCAKISRRCDKGTRFHSCSKFCNQSWTPACHQLGFHCRQTCVVIKTCRSPKRENGIGPFNSIHPLRQKESRTYLSSMDSWNSEVWPGKRCQAIPFVLMFQTWMKVKNQVPPGTLQRNQAILKIGCRKGSSNWAASCLHGNLPQAHLVGQFWFHAGYCRRPFHVHICYTCAYAPRRLHAFTWWTSLGNGF